MIEGSCHCGAVKIEVPQLPEKATQCNCSMCRRYAAVWAYYTEQTVQVTTAATGTATYCWGDKYINFHHCTQCGCITHYTSTEKADSDLVAVNLNMMSASVVEGVKVRKFDGADTWKFLD